MNPFEVGLRSDVRRFQMDHGPAAYLYRVLYGALVDMVNFLGIDDGRPLPLITLAKDSTHNWRGQYAAVGAFGLESVVTLNVAKFDTADKMLPTLGHEVAHWHTGHNHDAKWRDTMRLLGLEADDQGRLRETFGEWWELVGERADWLRSVHL